MDTGHAREVDLAVQMPEQELGPIATHELWGGTLDSVADLVRSHQTTLVFVNTRRLAERVAHQLSLRIGEDAVATAACRGRPGWLLKKGSRRAR